jgi:hypothetical protein
MKQKMRIFVMIGIITIVTAAMLFSGPGNGRGSNGNNGSNGQPGTGYSLADYPVQDLSAGEEAGLMLMYEEEKLARDVYTVLYEKWGLRIFNNIARSEQTHIDAIKQLLQRYGLSTYIPGPGEFTNYELSALYDELTQKGTESVVNALIVGATIEDLDIADLARLISETDNADIKVVYNNLQKGSRNHLRSFYSQLERYGGSYSPTYISLDLFERIISTDNERGGISDPDFVF